MVEARAVDRSLVRQAPGRPEQALGLLGRGEQGGAVIDSHVTWSQVRADRVARAGGEEAVAAAKDELTAQVVGYKLTGVRRAAGFTQAQIAERMGVTKGRVSQIERGKISG